MKGVKSSIIRTNKAEFRSMQTRTNNSLKFPDHEGSIIFPRYSHVSSVAVTFVDSAVLTKMVKGAVGEFGMVIS